MDLVYTEQLASTSAATTVQSTELHATSSAETIIENQRKALDSLQKQLSRRKAILCAEEKQLRNEYEMLQKQCKHPKQYFMVEYEHGVYGGKTKMCTLCGWSYYTD